MRAPLIGAARWLVAAGLGTCFAAAHAGPSLDRIKQQEKIVIGYRDAALPFSYLAGASKAPVGYSIDLCLKLAEAVKAKLQLKRLDVVYHLVNSANRVPSVVDGTVDLECEATTNTAERREQVAFIVPHFITGARYVVRSDSTIAELRDFQGQTLVSTVATNPLRVVREKNATGLLHIDLVEVPDHLRGLELVETGKAAGFVMDEVLLSGLLASRPGASKLKIIGKYLTVEPLAIMVSKKEPELKAIADEEMKRLIRSGYASKAYDRWFLKPIPPNGATMGLPMNYLMKEFWKYPTDWVPN